MPRYRAFAGPLSLAAAQDEAEISDAPFDDTIVQRLQRFGLYGRCGCMGWASPSFIALIAVQHRRRAGLLCIDCPPLAGCARRRLRAFRMRPTAKASPAT